MDSAEAVELFINSKRSKGLSRQTIKWYRGILLLFVQRYPELPACPEAIEGFLASCKAGDERRHGYYRALRCFYHYLHRRFGVPNLVELVEAPRRTRKQPRFLVPGELNQLLALPLHPKVKASILFMIDTGARLGEVASLTIDCLAETSWGFTATINGKTGMRTVPICYEVYHALMVNLPFNWSEGWLGRLISEAFKQAGIKGSAHTLRHSFGTLWQGDELALQRIMGHSSLATTKIYRHLRTEYLAQQHAQYSPLKMVLSSSKAML